ncbi:MAG: adaptor protein MecA [Clostridia bacterium]
MKIERIADNAINIYISSKDLASRNLDVSTLKEGTHDFDKLIWDAIDHANIEFGHEFEDRQLNVVNKPDGNGGLVLMISHDMEEDYEDNFYYDEENEEILNKFDKILKNAAKSVRNENQNQEPAFSEDAEEDSAEEEEPEDSEYEGDEEEEEEEEENSASAEQQGSSVFDMSNIPPEAFRNLFHKIRVQNRNQKVAQQHASGKKQEKPEQAAGNAASPIKFIQPARKNSVLSDWDVLIFPEFNDMLEFFSRNKSFKTIASSLYTYRGAYYLVLKPNSKNLNMLNRLESLVIDYNATYLPAESFLPLLKERGTILMEHGAISKLINYFEL